MQKLVQHVTYTRLHVHESLATSASTFQTSKSLSVLARFRPWNNGDMNNICSQCFPKQAELFAMTTHKDTNYHKFTQRDSDSS